MITFTMQGTDFAIADWPTIESLRELNPGVDDETLAAVLDLVGSDLAATGSVSLPLGEQNESWDGGAAANAMEGADQLQIYHFWRDPDGDADAAASYKLPFGTPEPNPHAVWSGVTSAAAALQGARGGVDIPDEDVAGVQSRIEGYYAKARDKYDDDTIEVPWASETAAAFAEQAAAGTWTAEPLIPYGELTRDGRMIRAGSLSWPEQLPVPLMSMLEDAHGGFADPVSVLAGSIDSFGDGPDGLRASGQLDDTEAGLAAIAAGRDGRMGISADLAIEEYEFVLPEDQVIDLDEEEGEIILADAGDASDDVPGGVVVEEGNAADWGTFVVTKAQVMGATIVPFAAFESARIDVTALTSDGAPARVTVTAALVVAVPTLEQLRAALEIKAISKNEARRFLGLGRMRGGG